MKSGNDQKCTINIKININLANNLTGVMQGFAYKNKIILWKKIMLLAVKLQWFKKNTWSLKSIFKDDSNETKPKSLGQLVWKLRSVEYAIVKTGKNWLFFSAVTISLSIIIEYFLGFLWKYLKFC